MFAGFPIFIASAFYNAPSIRFFSKGLLLFFGTKIAEYFLYNYGIQF